MDWLKEKDMLFTKLKLSMKESGNKVRLTEKVIFERKKLIKKDRNKSDQYPFSKESGLMGLHLKEKYVQ